MRQVVLASNNLGKCREFSALLAPSGIELLPQSHFEVGECDEPHASFVENALHKARHASTIAGLPALADDSGLCVAALQGAPGVRSARYAGEHGNDQENCRKLLEVMQLFVEPAQRQAYFYCALVLVQHQEDPTPIIACGRWSGEISTEMRGAGGFGYDPLFYVPQLRKTAAELTADEKNSLSHRANAVQNFLAQLQYLY